MYTTAELMFLFGLTFLCINKEAQAQGERWTSVGPHTGVITHVVIDPVRPGTVYAYSHDSGIFKTTNGGKSWSEANTGLSINLALYVNDFAIDRKDTNILFAATSEGAFKSVDGGANWTSVLRPHSISSLAIDPSNSRVIYAAYSPYPSEDNLFKSTDGGANWVASSYKLGVGRTTDIVVAPSKTNIIYASTDKGVVKSTDGGANWTLSTQGMSRTLIFRIAVDSSNPSIIYSEACDRPI